MRESLQRAQQRVEQQLVSALGSLNIADPRLSEAMHYGLLNGGKRLRPFLAYATAEAMGSEWSHADAAAVALEMVHSYSLIHDDLPAMDDDDLRRGQPTCHIAFDEATAVLTGDALLTAAFEHLAAASLSAQQRLKLIQLLAVGSGSAGMVAGQTTDLSYVGQRINADQLAQMHHHKTGALIRSAVLMGAYSHADTLSDEIEQALIQYANAIGLAFQIQDDILDVEGDTQTLGKTQGADEALDKPTYPSLMGLEPAREKAQQLVAEAKQALETLSGNTEHLEQIADYIIQRNH